MKIFGRNKLNRLLVFFLVLQPANILSGAALIQNVA
jgi:hypothetical protein